MADFPVVLDADVLYGVIPTDLLITTAARGLYRAHWTEKILEEASRNLIANRPDLDPSKVDRRFEKMNVALPGAMIPAPPDELVASMTNHSKDRHVLAAAVSINAEVIVTNNIKDFQPEACDPFGVEPQTLDDFITGLVSLNKRQVWSAITEIAERLQNPPKTPEQVCATLSDYAPETIRQLTASH